jgi:hypothetical protein
LARAAAVEVRLDIGFRQGKAGRAAIHNDADTTAMGFAPGGDAEQMPEVVCHKGNLAEASGWNNAFEARNFFLREF